jgi:MATE family multidrug resistance protein
MAIVIAAAMGLLLWLTRAQVAALYTADAQVLAVAVPLLAWVAVFHVVDAVQAVASFVLRAYRVATVPMLIYAGSLWGLGLGGGYLLAFDASGLVPAVWRGALGYWAAAAAGLAVAAGALVWLMWHVLRRPRAARPAAQPAAQPGALTGTVES